MGKTKASATGKGYLGEIMVHRITGDIGIVENVVEAQAGWAPEITIKLKDGTLKKGKLTEFKDATSGEKKRFSPPAEDGAADTEAKST